jgi:O-antigen/teichoic acid export membrane protein
VNTINTTRPLYNLKGRAKPGRVTANVGLVTAAYTVSRLLYLALIGFIGHLRGFEGVGYYAVATAIGAAFVFATDLGLSPRLTRMLATHSPDGLKAASRSMGAKLCMSLIVFPVLALIPIVISLPLWAIHLCILLLLTSIFDSLSYLCYAVADGFERVDIGAVGSLVQTVAWVGTAAALIAANLSLTAIGWAAVAGSVAEFLFSLYAARKFMPISVAKPRMKDISESLPFAVTALTSFCVWQIDVVIVSMVAGTIIAGALFLVLFCIGKQIMTMVYGSAFSHLYMPLAIGAAFIFLRFVSSVLACALTASGHQNMRALSMITGLAATCASILVLFPLAGVTGGVLALIVGEFVYVVFVTISGRGSFNNLLSLRSLVTVAVSAFTGAGLSLLVGGGIFTELGAALLTYVCLLWLGGELELLVLLIQHAHEIRIKMKQMSQIPSNTACKKAVYQADPAWREINHEF